MIESGCSRRLVASQFAALEANEGPLEKKEAGGINPPAKAPTSNGLGLLGKSGLDDHAATHLQVQGMAEVGAVIPIDTGLIGLEGARLGLLGIDDEGDVVPVDREAVGEVLDLVQVGQDDRHFVALLHRELGQ